MAKKGGLGKGLGAIFENAQQAYMKEISNLKSDMLREIPIKDIYPNPYQPRVNFNDEELKDLSDSIESHGLIQPVIVIKKDDKFMLIAGERRLRATKLLGHKNIKAIIADIKSKNLRELALIENIQRKDLNPIELAKSYKELINDYKITQENLSKIICKSRTQITNTMRLLNLSSKTQELIQNEKLSQGHAKILVGLDSDIEEKLVDSIIGQKLSVRESEELIRKFKKNKDTSGKNISNNFLNIEKELEILRDKFSNLQIKSSIKNNSLLLKIEDKKDIEKLLKLFA